jgi:hypothetical protein
LIGNTAWVRLTGEEGVPVGITTVSSFGPSLQLILNGCQYVSKTKNTLLEDK